MSEPGSSSANRRRRQSDEAEDRPVRQRKPKTDARQRVAVESGGPPITERVNLHETWGNWESLVDNVEHRIQHVDLSDLKKAREYIFCGAPKQPARIYRRLSNARVKACIRSSKWHYVCSMPQERSDQKCVLALIERWWDTTHTFHLPFVEIGFTPYDLTCLTGIPVGQSKDLPPYQRANWDTLDKLREFFPNVSRADCDSSGIKCAYLKKLLNEIPLPVCENENVAATEAELKLETMWLRAFFLLVIGEIFFPNNKKWVSFGWFEALRVPSMIGEFDWGTPILGRMYSGLDESSRCTCKSGQFFWTVLQYWYYEYIRIPGPVLREPVPDVYPRMLRWAPERRLVVVGAVDHELDAYRRKLEEITFYSLMWCPFADSQIIYDHPDCVASLRTSKFRFPLNINGICLWYLGDRVWRQLTGAASVPEPPPKQMKVHVADFDRWTEAGDIPIPAYDFRMTVDGNAWATYWGRVSRGPVLSARFRQANTDEVSTAVTVDYRLLPGAPRVFQPPGPYPSTMPVEDITAYFVNLSMDVPDSAQQLRIPEAETYVAPQFATPSDWSTLSTQLGTSALGFKHELTRMYDLHGYPINEFGYDVGASTSTTYQPTQHPGFDFTQGTHSMASEPHHNLGDDDDDDDDDYGMEY